MSRREELHWAQRSRELRYRTEDYLVTVCSACRRASCWHYVFPCDNASKAGTVDVLASKLREEKREHPSHFEERP